MNELDELDAYIKLKDLELEHPFGTEIPIASGKRKSSEEFVFAITDLKISSSGLGTPRLRANTKILFLMNSLKRSERR